MEFRVGLGGDLHLLSPGRGIPLGGVFIACPFSCVAVSDGDVLLHALVDALLGACGCGDIGEHHKESTVPPGQDSAFFVHETMRLLADRKAKILNVDCTVNLEKPNLGAWKGKIRDNLSVLLGISPARVNVKAKTGEGIGPVGESRAVSAEAVVLMEVEE